VFRTCANPNAPVLSPAPGYSVFTTNSTRAALVLDPTSFTFAATGFSDASLAAALARYAALAFPYGAAQAPASAATLLGLRVDVAGDAPLAEGVNETYALDVRAGWAVLQAATVYGAMRGLETFSQLLAFNLSTREYSAQPTTVVDFPRFPVRAVMLDTARTFLSVAAIKSVMDAMSYLKLNVLHLHLTDDNSWPVVIDAWPRLALLSAYSNFSHTYSKADLAALVTFGRERGIRLVPEFDTPAHFSSLFAAYPEFAAVSVDPKTNDTFLCLVDPSKEETFAFLADIWRELAASFPDETLMIGGDEAWGCWAESPAVAAWMKARGYGVEEALHYYERRMIGIVRSLGRKTMAWLDIDGWPLANETWAREYADVTLNVWTGCYSGRWQDDVAAFTAKNGSVVVSGPYYITQQNGRPDTPHFTPQDMYATDLYNFTGNATVDLRLIRGGELCAWDDAAQTDSGDILVSLSPYMVAVAEAWWSPQAATSGVGFDEQRAHQHRCRMVARGIASHPFYAFGAYCPFEYAPAEWAASP
jgi:hexosaminidase